MAENLLTPTKITAWLDCAHYLTLRHEVDSGIREAAPHTFGAMARMLTEKGDRHEEEVLKRYRASGRTVLEVPERETREPFARWVARLGDLLSQGHDVVYQMPFVHGGIRGIADFLERVTLEDGSVTYEPVDAKLARNAAKPGHVLQLCFYAEAIASQTGTAPERMHIELGSGERESIRVDDVMAYWRRLRSQLATLVGPPPSGTTPEPCNHCAFCEFEPVCDAQWRASDSLVHVAGLRSAERQLLEHQGVATIAALADLDQPPADLDSLTDIDSDRVRHLARQASLQVQARQSAGLTDSQSVGTVAPPFVLLDLPATHPDASAEVGGEPGGGTEAEPGTETGSEIGMEIGTEIAGTLGTEPTEPLQPAEQVLKGFAALPHPDDGDVFLDFEGHPFWKADVGLFFLLGLIEQDQGRWRYRAFWAHDRQDEAQATADLVHYLTQRRRDYPGMHVYHYNHTERSALTRLAAEYAVAELELEHLVSTGAFVDLLPIVTGALQVGVESYGLKHIELLTDFRRSHDIERGAGAVVEYENWMRDADGSRLDRIARYNEDDVRATRAVRDWLVDHRPNDVPWRPAVLEPPMGDEALDERIERLHAYGPGTPEHLMGDLLGYWRRERSVLNADCLRLSMAEVHEQLASPDVIARLEFRGIEDRIGKGGRKRKWPAGVFTFPDQPIDPDIQVGSKMILALHEEDWAFFSLCALDRDAGTLAIEWKQEAQDMGAYPPSLVHYPLYREGAKLDALRGLADQMLDGEASSVGHAILRRDAPAFLPGMGPDGPFTGSYQAICAWAPYLDGSFVPVQGPPGTGKTFTGAHIVHTLVKQGKRVGITAMSHNAIDNQVRAVVHRFRVEGDTLRAVRKAPNGSVDGVSYVNDNGRCASGPYDVVAGTPWLFASKPMREHPVDVLIVDEAGQLGLADTLAASFAAANVILLGDPQQLPQVAQASHPNRSGVSALEHLLGEDARTFPPERGVLLDKTWRMHPDVCDFISDVMYEGRLTSEVSTSRQTTSAGTGLRWIRAEHTDRSTESPEEAGLVVTTIEGLIGTDWTDQAGIVRPLTVDDVIVVTPYNDQRRRVTAALEARPATAGVEVGTVDKFQGRQAAVVLFSMATSSADFMPRDAEFLFSKNRLNVAVSRARCLAYLICTDELLNTRARDVDQMTLISALCSFVERAVRVEVSGAPEPGG